MATAPRIFIKDILLREQSFTLSKEQSHHLTKVLRLGVGSEIEAVGQNSKVFLSVITQAGKEITATPIKELPCQNPSADITLIIAACKGEKNDFIIEKGTELGVNTFLFFQSEHSSGKVSEDQLERFNRKAEAAASQSKRNRLPTIKIFKNYLSLKPEIIAQSRILFSLSENSRYLTTEIIKSQDICLAVGSEGDFSPTEYSFFREMGFFEASLGNTILRSETAAIAGIAGVLALFHSKQ